MLTLTIRQLTDKLPKLIEARLAIAVIGPPGTGKTYNSIKSAEKTGLPVEVLDGGQENQWKALFPYKSPSGVIELGTALRASGYQMIDGKLTKVTLGGVLVIDEVNRVPVELKSSFQLLASQKVVPWPEGGVVEVDLSIIATANPLDLGVEESGRAELDRYDLTFELRPTPEEVQQILMKNSQVTLEVAKIIWETVSDLSGRLDPKKFYQPEGIRMAASIAKVLRTGTLGAADVLKSSSERCWPMGRKGAEKNRAEFDTLVTDVAGRFAGKMANVDQMTSTNNTAQAASSNAQNTAVATLQDLKASLAGSLQSKVSASALPLPKAFIHTMHMFTQSFGAGVTMHMMKNAKAGGSAERRGVKVHFGAAGSPDKVEFRDVDKHQVDTFLRLALGA